MNNKKIKALLVLNSLMGCLKSSELIRRKDLATTVEQFNMADIKISSKEGANKASLNVVKQGENVFLRDALIKTALVNTEFAKQSYLNFCLDYVTVTADKKVWKDLNRRSIFVDHATGKIYAETTSKKKNKAGELVDALRDLTGNNKLVIRANQTNAIEYKFFISTSGLVKESSAIFYRAESAESANAILDKHIPGIIANLPENIRQEAAVKFAARPGLAWTKGVEVSHFENVLKVEGNFDNADFEGKDRNTGDGAIKMRASAAAKTFNLKTQAEAVGMIFQARFFGIYKFQIIVIADQLFDQHVEYYKANRATTSYGTGSPDFIIDDNAQKAIIDVSQGFTLTLMSMGKFTIGRLNKQIIESLLVAGAETGRLQEVVDFLESNGEDFIVGAASRALNTTPGAMKMFRNTNVNGDKIAPYSLDVLNSLKPNNPIAARVRLDDSISTMAKMIDKLAIELYTENGVSEIYNGVVCTDIAAFIGKSIIPKGFIVVGKVSKELSRLKRVYGESSEYKKYKEEFGTVTMFKMPKMYFNEFYQAQVLDLEEIAELINKSDVPEEMKAGYKFHFENMADATVMFPADRGVFELLAGMDIDFDKVVAVFNKYINKLLAGRQENLFISSKVAGSTKKVNSSKVMDKLKNKHNITTSDEKEVIFNTREEGFFYDVFMLQLEGEGQIGVITFYNNKVIAMLLEALTGNIEPAIHFLKESVESTKGLDRAYSVDRKIVDPLFVDMMLAEMKEVVWNPENIVAFLKDCSKVFRLYQETAIDAAKTGIYLVAKLTVRTIVADSLLSVGVEYVTEKDEVEEVIIVDGKKETRKKVEIKKFSEIKRAEYTEKTIRFFEKNLDGSFTETREPMTTKNLADVMGRIQTTLIKAVNEDIKKVYEVNKDTFKYTSAEVGEMNDELMTARSTKKGCAVVRDLYTIKAVYHDIVSKYIETLNSLDSKSESYEQKLEALKEANKKQVESISNAARKVVAGYGNAYATGALALAIGCSTKKDYTVNPENKSRFAYNVLPEYTLAYLTGGEEVKATGTVIKNFNPLCDVEELEFVNGVSVDGSVLLAERFTGMATVAGREVSTIVSMFDAVEVKENESTLIVAASGNEEVIGEMTRDSIVAISSGSLFFNKDENSDFVAMKNKIFFDGNLKEDSEYYINDSQVVELWVKSNGANKKVKCFVLSLEVA